MGKFVEVFLEFLEIREGTLGGVLEEIEGLIIEEIQKFMKNRIPKKSWDTRKNR